MVVGSYIIKNNYNVLRTQSRFVSISPIDGDGYCEDLITFNVEVRCPDFRTTYPTGNFEIIDLLSNSTLASGTLAAGLGSATSSALAGNYNLIVNYLGEVNQFSPSQSPAETYNVNGLETDTTITSPLALDIICFNNFSATAQVNYYPTRVPVPVNDGYVTFKIYEVDSRSATPINAIYNIGTAEVNGSGIASLTYTEGLSISFGFQYYVEARYLGSSCFRTSNSPQVEISPLEGDITTLTIGALRFNYDASATLTATVTGTTFPDPSDGYVLFTSEYLDGRDIIIVPLGTAIPSSGAISLNIPAYTYPSAGLNITVTAQYFSDTACYADSNIDTQIIYT